MVHKRICFKCHGEVPIENDDGELGRLLFGDPTGLKCGSRTLHFLPVVTKDENGVDIITCKGSPYRAQYLNGQPRYGREYVYFEFLEVRIRAAYQKLQDMAKAMAIEKEIEEKSNPSSTEA